MTRSPPQNDRLNFIFVEDIHAVGKKWLEMVVKWKFRPVANFGQQDLDVFTSTIYNIDYKALTKQEGPNLCWDAQKIWSCIFFNFS